MAWPQTCLYRHCNATLQKDRIVQIEVELSDIGGKLYSYLAESMPLDRRQSGKMMRR